MILDRLSNWPSYAAMHPLFPQAFRFLIEADWDSLKDGRIPIQGDEIFVLLSSDHGRGREKSPLEFHRRYWDIQLVLSGNEEMGWLPLTACSLVAQTYDPVRDIGFFADTPQGWFAVAPGQFSVFTPQDAHAPLAGQGLIRKAVVKVADSDSLA